MLQDFQLRPNPETTVRESNSTSRLTGVVIAGGGIIGLSIALELHYRGVAVTVLERGKALQQASTAAAGMLAADDPHNPPALLPISRYSLSLYPEYLQRIESLSGLRVPFQTTSTVQYRHDGSSVRLAEHSVDPRQLAEALLGAVRATSIVLLEETAFESMEDRPDGVNVFTSRGEHFFAHALIVATGAWSGGLSLHAPLPVEPRKGQMLRVRIPAGLRLEEVHRSEQVYIVPRTQGPQAGTALIGATVEDAGFDVSTTDKELAGLRRLAAALFPALASEVNAPMVEAWAGLRPGTADQLPFLGRAGDQIVAAGHFRNGILLAPATAVVIADIFEGKLPSVDLSPFHPSRAIPVPAMERGT